MKSFADLHLCVPVGKPDEMEIMIEKSADLGYRAVGIVFPDGGREEAVQRVREVCSTFGVDLVTRVDLTPRDPADMLRKLRILRRKTEVVAMQCYSKSIARQAAKDRRVDLISFPSTDFRKRFFDSAEAELASEASASLEVDLAPLLRLQGFPRARLLSFLRRETLIAKKLHVPIVLSSGANDQSFLRKPGDYVAFSYLFGLDRDEAEQAFSENPNAIVERNRRKLSSGYVAPGVQLVRRGKDCPNA